jgi:hypothetical protein
MPQSKILLSTWDDENTEDIEGICEIIKTKKPDGFNIQFQKVGSLSGLNRIECDIILKCRTDQYIDAPHMFSMFRQICNSKILISNYCTIDQIDYFASDFCQLATKNVLLNFWSSIDENVGGVPHPEVYLTRSYILNYHKDSLDWKSALKKYFHVADFHKDWKIKWLKLDTILPYKHIYENWYPKCVHAFEL